MPPRWLAASMYVLTSDLHLRQMTVYVWCYPTLCARHALSCQRARRRRCCALWALTPPLMQTRLPFNDTLAHSCWKVCHFRMPRVSAQEHRLT
ncbi:hypothetical protein F5I97DRAFT_1268233 [Phlebopus sp. FC_14]|nr:hypothetical protein F5I97DRAFT_1268233 [Phlebopus sp. FC_14]